MSLKRNSKKNGRIIGRKNLLKILLSNFVVGRKWSGQDLKKTRRRTKIRRIRWTSKKIKVKEVVTGVKKKTRKKKKGQTSIENESHRRLRSV